MSDQVRQRVGGGGGNDSESNPLIIDLGSSSHNNNNKPSKSKIGAGGKLRTGSPKQVLGAFMPMIIVFGCICFASLFAIIAIAGLSLVQQQQPSDDIAMEIGLLRNKIKELERTKQRKDETAANVMTDTKAQEKIQILRAYKDRMHYEIQKISKRQLYEQYGRGPYTVQIIVEFDPSSNIYSETKTGGTITIQLADAEDMPASVFLFLQQVTTGLMDGCSFHRNAHHVVQGGPAANFLHSKAKHREFKEANLDSVPFQEYSPKFPHKKYTLGYAGRPGGPDFYISTIDNTRNHGPGGQDSYADPTEADPCFAKVVDGFDIVDLMHQSKVKPGGYNAMEHNIAIREMKFIRE